MNFELIFVIISWENDQKILSWMSSAPHLDELNWTDQEILWDCDIDFPLG